MKKTALLLGILLTCILASHAQKTAYTMPEVNKILKDMHLYLEVELEDSIKQKSGFDNTKYLMPLTNYIDYNVIGKGNMAVIDDAKLREYISKEITSGKSLRAISKELIDVYTSAGNSTFSSGEKTDLVQVGGFFAGGVEVHQEPNGHYDLVTEINQIKLNFTSSLNSSSNKNRVNIFAEFNPVPEEVILQIDEVNITKGANQEILSLPHIEDDEGSIPFERAFIRVSNIGGSGINLTYGQFRNPFGFWSDYTSHRNITSTKNNYLVNGFALKKIELGLMLDYQPNKYINIEAALVNGRTGRTAPLYREDFDHKKDLVAHITYARNRIAVGGSAYLAEVSLNKRVAYGIDFAYRANKLLLSGEYVWQRNRQIDFVSNKLSALIRELSSHAAYLQFDYEFNEKLHFYGLYDFWDLRADGQTVEKPLYKAFHGLKYFINPKTRWTILEYGAVINNRFDQTRNQFASYLEINF